jgi:copper chaperone CopZ
LRSKTQKPERTGVSLRRKIMKKKFKCEIDCANCAAKVEEAVKKIDGVNDAKVNFMLQKFTLDADDERFDEILKEAVETGKKIEPDFSVEM